jgi:hypothetical protein
MKNRFLAIFAAAVLVLCVGVLWFIQRPAPVDSDPVALPEPKPLAATLPFQAPAPAPVSKPVDPEPPKPSKTQPVQPLAPWEQKIEQALRADLGETETAQLLINMLPTIPAEGQVEAAQHISNLLLDKDYSRVLPLVKNPKLSQEVLDVFVSDLLNRTDSVKLSTLLEIAKQPNHPHQAEAISDLQIFLDQDHGSDWNKWDGSVKAYLKKQAQEEAATPEAEPQIGQPKPSNFVR